MESKNKKSNSQQEAEISALLTIIGTAKNWMEREQAAKVLPEFGEKATQLILAALKADSLGKYGGINLAIEALGEIGDKSSVEQLIEFVKYKYPHVRQDAAKALGKIGDPRAIEPLIESFKVDSGDTEDMTAWQNASQALGKFGKVALPFIEVALKDADKQVRLGLIESLGLIKDHKSLELLINNLNNVDYMVRTTVAESLGKLGDNQAIQPLLKAFKNDESFYVRLKSAESLGILRSLEAVPAFLETLTLRTNDITFQPDDISWKDVRHSIAIALGRVRDPDSVGGLISELGDEDIWMRWFTITALGQIGSKQALPALVEIYEKDKRSTSDGSSIAKTAKKAIKRINNIDSSKLL